MRYDAFSKCHPAVNFLFFVGAIGMSVVIQHPVYLLAGIVTGTIYYQLLNGKKRLEDHTESVAYVYDSDCHQSAV